MSSSDSFENNIFYETNNNNNKDAVVYYKLVKNVTNTYAKGNRINDLFYLLRKVDLNKKTFEKSLMLEILSTYYNLLHDKMVKYFTPKMWGLCSLTMILKPEYGCMEFCEKFKHKIRWKLLSQYNTIYCKNFYSKFRLFLDWKSVICFQNIDEDLIRTFHVHMDWNTLVVCNRLSEQLLQDYNEKIDMNQTLTHQHLSEEFIERFIDRMSWPILSNRSKYTDKFLHKYSDRLDWNIISDNGNVLSNDQIRIHADKLNWKSICKTYTLDEGTMYTFSDRLDWKEASLYQYMSKEFLLRFGDKLHWYNVLLNKKIALSRKDIAEILSHLGNDSPDPTINVN